MKARTFIVAADSHGHHIDRPTRDAILACIEQTKPEVRIHLGDAFNFGSLRKGAADHEKSESLKEDLREGYSFLNAFYKGAKERHLLLGNHDWRLWLLAENGSGVAKDYAAAGVETFKEWAKHKRVNWLPYDARHGVLQIGHLKFIHGYASGKNAGTKHANAYGNVVYGHTHNVDVTPIETHEGAKEARCIAALCQIDLDYDYAHLGKLLHENGWAYGLLFEDGSYQIFQTRKIGGKFYVATDFKAF